MAAKRLESVRGRGTTARRRRGREGNTINTDITLNYCIVSGRRRRGAAAAVTPPSRCGCGWTGAPRRCRAAPARRGPRRRSRCSTSARTASTAPSACAAPRPAPRPPASRGSPGPAGTRSPRGSATHQPTRYKLTNIKPSLENSWPSERLFTSVMYFSPQSSSLSFVTDNQSQTILKQLSKFCYMIGRDIGNHKPRLSIKVRNRLTGLLFF